jgi:hypothetical protein
MRSYSSPDLAAEATQSAKRSLDRSGSLEGHHHAHGRRRTLPQALRSDLSNIVLLSNLLAHLDELNRFLGEVWVNDQGLAAFASANPWSSMVAGLDLNQRPLVMIWI